MPKETIKSIKETLAHVEGKLKLMILEHDRERAKRIDAENEVKATRAQYPDLKNRLHHSEMEVARLNGYLARVREDDVVREELVTVGEPDGQQRMVPKRKHEYLGNRESNSSAMECLDGYSPREKFKHWIEY